MSVATVTAAAVEAPLDFIFTSQDFVLVPFFSRSSLENERQARVRCSRKRAVQIAEHVRKRGVEDLVLRSRQCGPLPGDDPSWGDLSW